MAWQLTDSDGETDVYASKRDVVEAIKMSMTDEEYIEAARDWGWKIKEVTAPVAQEADQITFEAALKECQERHGGAMKKLADS